MVASQSPTEHAVGEIHPPLAPALWRWLRVVLVAGVPTGMVIGGAGSRLAMLALRATSSPSVIGVTSDDGFRIGQLTLSGTYNLLQLGAFVGMVGATAYLLVRPWLVGPPWFGDLTVGMASGTVVGSMLLHADGVDFRLLTPRWFAMALFIALPAVFGTAIGPAVRTMERRAKPTGWRQLVAPAVVLGVGPGSLLASLVVVPVLLLYTVVTERPSRNGPLGPVAILSIRAFWLTLAIVGLVSLVDDVRAINALP